jgi:gamma-glutamyltranspeptidase/glutathione hydrolase
VPRLGPSPTPTAIEASASASAEAATATAPVPTAIESAAATNEPASPTAVLSVPPPEPPIALAFGGERTVRSKAGLATTVEPNATRAAVQMLDVGGNAIDAAIAAAYVLAVTHPSAGNLGGGGFLVVRLADGRSAALDFRDAAPAATTSAKLGAAMKLGGTGWPSVAVPGTVAGLERARERWGTLPRATILGPATELARKGHALSAAAAARLAKQWKELRLDPTARAIFGKSRGKAPLATGDRLVQRDLAETLSTLAKRGAAGFYGGRFAKALAAACATQGCDVTEADLAKYQARERATLRFVWRGFEVETMPPPSMGGLVVAQILLDLERQGALAWSWDEPRAVHAFVESAKQGYAVRRALGFDPDFDAGNADAVAEFLSPARVAARTATIDPGRPRAVSELVPPERAESPETTHVSVVDAQGNAASLTVTLSASFGAKVVVPGTGVLMSNTLGAFSGSGPNAPAPGKHAASSMSPTIVSRGGKVEIVIGSPGGDTIPNTVAQVLRNLAGGMTVDRAIETGRVHHQLAPDVIRTESARNLPKATIAALRAMGHRVDPSRINLGDVKAIVIDPRSGEAWGYADPREGGLALGVTPRRK